MAKYSKIIATRIILSSVIIVNNAIVPHSPGTFYA
jgi:hypothetical protein